MYKTDQERKGKIKNRYKSKTSKNQGKRRRKEDILVMFSSPELFNEMFGITDHGLDLLWLRGNN